jgi:hypothetical protein
MNCRFDNLRKADKSQNNANAGLARHNTSGLKGVSWDSRTNKFRAQIGKNSQNIWLGRFETGEAAHAAYVTASRELFGEFACSG